MSCRALEQVDSVTSDRFLRLQDAALQQCQETDDSDLKRLQKHFKTLKNTFTVYDLKEGFIDGILWFDSGLCNCIVEQMVADPLASLISVSPAACLDHACALSSNYTMSAKCLTKFLTLQWLCWFVQDCCRVCQMAAKKSSCTSLRRRWRGTVSCCVSTSPAMNK